MTVRQDTRVPPRVLVVDDSVNARRLVRSALERHGYEVAESEDGARALATFRVSPPDLVITDSSTPSMDGVSLVREIRALPAWRFVPVLILTTEGERECKRRGCAAGSTGWIVKPFHPEELCQVVARVLGPRG